MTTKGLERWHSIIPLVALLVSMMGIAPTTSARDRDTQWVGSWSASPHEVGPLGEVSPPYNTGIANQTIRNNISLSVGGSALRLRLSNAVGTQPVTFNAVYVGLLSDGARLVTGSNRAVTFGGSPSVTIREGAHVLSDPVGFETAPGQVLTVSLFSAGSTGPMTGHSFASQINFVSGAGNWAWDERPDAFTTYLGHWFFLDAVDVLTRPSVKGAVVALGDSITDGVGSTINANRRWPDYLARRFADGPDGQAMSVLNEGISGNNVLSDSPCFGVNAQARLDRDVLSQTDVRAVILLEGINDIQQPDTPTAGLPPFVVPCLARTQVSAADIIAGYQHIIGRVHAKGIKIYGGTLTPYRGWSSWGEAGEAKRQAVNRWVRTSGAFDGVIDFDQALRDPSDPMRLVATYDSGDHLHPSDAGYRVMGDLAYTVLSKQED